MEEEQEAFRLLTEMRDVPEEVIVAAEKAGLDNARCRRWHRCNYWPFGREGVTVDGGPLGRQSLYNGVATGITGTNSISWYPVGDSLYTCDYCVGQDRETKNILWASRTDRCRANQQMHGGRQ